MACRLIRFAVFAAVGSLVGMPAPADEFRLETDIFAGNQQKVLAQSLTLFADGLVYDFPLTGPEEITVFDPTHRRFVLLDCRRKVKTTLTAAELLGLVETMNVQARQLGGVVAAAAEPRFQIDYDAQSLRLTLASPVLTYRAKCLRPKSESVVATYQTFADWYARLNAIRPGCLPAPARIALNRAMAERKLIPQEVTLKISPRDREVDRNLIIRARHAVYWQLTATDRKRIETAGRHMVEFQAVTFRDYEKELVAAIVRRDRVRR